MCIKFEGLHGETAIVENMEGNSKDREKTKLSLKKNSYRMQEKNMQHLYY